MVSAKAFCVEICDCMLDSGLGTFPSELLWMCSFCDCWADLGRNRSSCPPPTSRLPIGQYYCEKTCSSIHFVKMPCASEVEKKWHSCDYFWVLDCYDHHALLCQTSFQCYLSYEESYKESLTVCIDLLLCQTFSQCYLFCEDCGAAGCLVRPRFHQHPSGTTSSTKHFRLTGALVFVVLARHSPSTASSTDHFGSLWDSIASKEGCSSDDSYWLLRFFGQEQSGVHRDYYSWKLIGNEDGGKGRLKEMRLIPLML